MFTYSKLFSLYKIINETCHRCLKHTTKKKVTTNKDKLYTNTVLLPKSDFPLWVTGFKRIQQDEKIMKDCGFSALYNWQRENVRGPEFVLHDGPPYANGMPHMGHAINKILKDITIRHKLLQGHKIHYKPGWDCHGLPIEQKAMAGQDYRSLTPLSIRAKARNFAKTAINDQKVIFRSWGVMADWETGCYYTFDKSYVKNQLQKFYSLYEKGLIYRDVKPVFWSPSSRTALAEAELEYKENHVSTSLYLRLHLSGTPEAWGSVYALVWTTTPWSLPANQAIAYNPTLPYSLVRLKGGTECYVVATPVVEQIATALQKELTVVSNIESSLLASLCYEHPLDRRQSMPLLPSNHVTADKGTGLVHIAPSHGPDDFILGKKFNLSTPCLVDESGLYTEEAGPELSGLDVLTTGTEHVIKQCRKQGALVHTTLIKHSYPYDWRTGLPIILRASQQWFFDTSAVKEQAVAALRDVNIIPEHGIKGLISQVQTRPYWCISRQRVWGVPIPVLYTSSGEPIISQELVDHYCQMLDSEGDDFWWSSVLSDLAPPHLLTKMDIDPSDIVKGQDILDIWLDSGLSWSAVLDSPSADLYLEGVDQFNGWFQASLMTSIALQQVPPYKAVFVHGFAVDETGRKMSKSLGNVINPQDIVNGGEDKKAHPTYGLDILRWWVTAHATQHASVPVSSTTLTDSKNSVQRLRSVLKFLLGGLHGLPPVRQAPALYHLDQYMLHCLHTLESQVIGHYNSYQYNQVCKTVTHFLSNQVSAVYCHLTKDRLYCDPENSDNRRAVQLTFYHILNTLTRLVAPIMPVLAEEVYSYQPVKVNEYLFHSLGPSTNPDWNNPHIASLIELALEVKQQVVKLSPLNCNNWELSAVVSAPPTQWQQLKALQRTEESTYSELAEILQVSHVTLRCLDHAPAVQVDVGLAAACLCERCRKYTAPTPETLCSRCDNVLASKN